MIKIYLWIIKLLSPVWKMLGADVDQLLLILKVKMQMSLMSPVSITPRKNSIKMDKLPAWARELMRIALGALFGLVYAAFLFIPNKEIAILYALFMYLATVSITMIMTFSMQLINTTDNIVLLPRPIKDKTLIIYRLLFGIYQFLISSVPMALAMIVILSMQYGILKGLYFFALLLPVLVMVFALLQMFIMLLLNIFSIRSFNKLIVWLQGALLILLFACCQDGFWSKIAVANLGFTLQHATLLSFLPPYWIVSIWMNNAPIWMYFATWGIPVLFLFFIVLVLAPKYSSKLSQLGSGGDGVTSSKKIKRTHIYKERRFFILKDKAAQSAYVFMKQYMSRTREFKMSALSSFYYVVIATFPLLMDIWKKMQGQDIVIKDSKLLFPVYSFFFPISMCILTLCGSSVYKASWVFYAAPDLTRGQVKFGSGWAVFTKFFIPGFIGVSVILLSFTKMALWSNLILAFSNILLLSLLTIYFSFKEMPLSVPQDSNANKSGGRSIRVIITIALGAGLGGLHAVLLMKLFWWVHLLIAALDIIAAWLIADKIKRSY